MARREERGAAMTERAPARHDFPRSEDLIRLGQVSAQPQPAQPPRLALTKTEAAMALGVSVDYLEQHVMHELRIVRRGRRRLIPLAELQRWLDDTARPTVDP
jgi:excisionase family DNA binding protein